MATRSENLFLGLQSSEAIAGLIGSAEDADIDFKEWRGPAANTGSLAKAACAFANATGGVIVIGISTARRRPGDPDVATGLCPVQDTEAVKAAALDIILKQVDPGVEGVQAKAVPDSLVSSSGYVVIHVPEAVSPQRSRQDWRFHVRIASGTVAMEMFQIADRFGRRPHPQLVAFLDDVSTGEGVGLNPGSWRKFTMKIENKGRGLAQHPALFAVVTGLVKQLYYAPSWREVGAGEGWTSYRGDANEVVYPSEKRTIVELYQRGIEGDGVIRYPELQIPTRTVALDMPQFDQVLLLPHFELAL